MNTAKRDFQSVTLTHIINPHMFWFRPDTSFCTNEKYLALEESLYHHFQDKKVFVNNRKQYGVGEMAAVFMDNWGKWIRVVVDRNVKMMHGKTKCILWAIDWGFPLQTDVERLLPLPVDCASIDPPNLYFGGLNYVLPSETIFDFTLMKSVESQSKDWSDLVVKEFRKLIDQASNIRFLPEIEIEGQHTFGRLEITTHNGIMIEAKDVLLHISGVMQIENTETFLSAIQNCNTTKIKRSHNNFNRLSFSDLNYSSLTSNALDTEYKIDTDFFSNQSAIDLAMALPSRNVVDKVVEWDRRNYDANSVLGLSECSSDVGTLTLDDEAFESISCYDPLSNLEREADIPDQRVDIVMQYYDDEDDLCFVSRCDLIRQEIRKKYKNRMPRDAKIPFELPRPKEENLETNVHIKKIIDKRQKIMDKMSVSSSIAHSNESDTLSNGVSIKSTYLDQILERRDRVLKSIEAKSTANKDMAQSPKPVRQQSTVNKCEEKEPEYDKEEQERRDKLLQSRRGTDRNICMYPADYPVSKITKEIQENNKSPSKNHKSQQPRGQQQNNFNKPHDHQKNQYQQRQNDNRNNNKFSPQQRLNKYKGPNFKSNTNSMSTNRSEVESEVW